MTIDEYPDRDNPSVFNQEFQREKSFPTSMDNSKKEKLSKAGLYYDSSSSRIMCAFCSMILLIKVDEPIENPKELHARINPSCSFLNNHYVGNIPKNTEENDKIEEGENLIDDNTECIPKHPEYKPISNRCFSFLGKWHLSFYLKVEELTSAGFIYHYKGNGQPSVQCYQCGVKCGLSSNENISAFDLHKKVNPICPLIQSPTWGKIVRVTPHWQDITNIDDNSCTSSNYDTDLDEIEDTTRSLGREFQENRSSFKPCPQLKQLAVDETIYPEFWDRENRRDSFKNCWVGSLSNLVPTMVNAGLFYTEKSDKVQCYSCGEVISDWKKSDNPWKKHEESAPNCQHIQAYKKRSFFKSSSTP